MLAATLVAVGGCSSNPGTSNDSAAMQPDAGQNGGASGTSQRNVGGSQNPARGGSAGRANSDTTDTTSTTDTTHTTDNADHGSAGASGVTDLPSTGDDLTSSCELNGNCSSKCEDSDATYTCGVQSLPFVCEFEGFNGATAQVACGERVVLGTTCCGDCGCVQVELFFDGSRCWQGIPDCALPAFKNRLVEPHPTTTPNPSFVPPDSFYLGNGGIGGKAPVASTGGGGGGGTNASGEGGANGSGEGGPNGSGGEGGARGSGEGGVHGSGEAGAKGSGEAGANGSGEGGANGMAGGEGGVSGSVGGEAGASGSGDSAG